MKHKHADLIHAWADGAVIQYEYEENKWRDCQENNPMWGDCRYRIKPEEKKPVVRWLWAIKDEQGVIDILPTFYSNDEIETPDPSSYIKLEWSRTEFPE